MNAAWANSIDDDGPKYDLTASDNEYTVYVIDDTGHTRAAQRTAALRHDF